MSDKLVAKCLSIPPVGQLDPYSCWAACLKFWYKAAKAISKKQSSLIAKYNYLTDEYGGMQPEDMDLLIVENNMYIEVHDNARDFTAEVVKDRLKFGPLFVAYTETASRKNHVNVIYGISGSGAGAQVRVMEPQKSENADLTFRGAHQVKNLSEFNVTGSVHFGYK
jgi:hypothetical protein